MSEREIISTEWFVLRYISDLVLQGPDLGGWTWTWGLGVFGAEGGKGQASPLVSLATENEQLEKTC